MKNQNSPMQKITSLIGIIILVFFSNEVKSQINKPFDEIKHHIDYNRPSEVITIDGVTTIKKQASLTLFFSSDLFNQIQYITIEIGAEKNTNDFFSVINRGPFLKKSWLFRDHINCGSNDIVWATFYATYKDGSISDKSFLKIQ